MNGLGISYPITLPVVGKQNIDVPVDRMAQDAINAAWPVLQAKLKAELPKLVAQATPAVEAQSRKLVLQLGVIIALSVGAAAWWIKRRG